MLCGVGARLWAAIRSSMKKVVFARMYLNLFLGYFKIYNNYQSFKIDCYRRRGPNESQDKDSPTAFSEGGCECRGSGNLFSLGWEPEVGQRQKGKER